MRYAICNEMYGDAPLDEAFGHAAKFGYTGIEIAPFTLGASAHSISEETKEEVRRCADRHGLEVLGLHWLLAKTEGLHLTTSDEFVRKQTAEYLAELARLCRDLGGKIMVFGSPQQRNIPDGMSDEQATENATDVFKKVVPVLEETGVTIALEPLGPGEGNFMLTAESGIDLARRIDSEFVKLHLDVKAMSSEDKPIDQIIRESAEWLVHFHANDPNLLGPGMGKVEYASIFAALKEIQYDGWVSVEVFDYSLGVDVLAGKSIEYMKLVAASLA